MLKYSFMTMVQLICWAILVFNTSACQSKTQKAKEVPVEVTNEKEETDAYTWLRAKNQEAVLILFPCFPCDNENTLSEFPIQKKALANGVSLLLMNYNKKLYLSEEEKEELAKQITHVLEKHHQTDKKVFIGGFSSGGNVSLLMADYSAQQNLSWKPDGVFVVDSPIDLLGLYRTSEANIERNFSEVSVQESSWLLEYFQSSFGDPDSTLEKYEAISPFIKETHNISNVEGILEMKVRAYTEPDSTWWMENRKVPFEETNAQYLKHFIAELKSRGGKNIEYITSQNKGYRANGDRHPHSWAIVDVDDLIRWMEIGG